MPETTVSESDPTMTTTGATTVTLTAIGAPRPEPGRGGAGTLVRCADVVLQFHAGRTAMLRMAETGVPPHSLNAVFVTQGHGDHVGALTDLAPTRWSWRKARPAQPLPVIAPAGGTATCADHQAPQAPQASPLPRTPQVTLTGFPVPDRPEVVWRSKGGGVTVTAVGVEKHETVQEAVAYRVDTPDGAVVISSDTRVCPRMEELCRKADLLVHEVCRTKPLAAAIRGTVFERIFGYQADTVALGTLAERAGVPHTVITHLFPAPHTAAEEAEFVQDLRAGGYAGQVTLGPSPAQPGEGRRPGRRKPRTPTADRSGRALGLDAERELASP